MKKDKLKKWIAIIGTLLLVELIFLAVTILREKTIPNQDKNAHKISSEYDVNSSVQEEDTVFEDGGSAMVICMQYLTVHTKSRTVDLFYQNPKQSKSVVSLELYIDDNLIAQSDKIPIGYQLDTMKVLVNLNAEAGQYSGYLKTVFYDPETLEPAEVDAGLDVWVNVKND